ncbi:MAG: hypothetical protein LUF30_06800, partial [Lachnospiraceae bacterium]|nr:hypothetical protein [Lachnospiraceae bacterium]
RSAQVPDVVARVFAAAGSYDKGCTLHDTGNVLYTILSFLLPIFGLIAAYVFRRKNYIRNYKACMKGAKAMITVIVVVLVILLLLILKTRYL